MARRSSNLWSKKANRGMRDLEKMVGLGLKLSSAAIASSKNQQKTLPSAPTSDVIWVLLSFILSFAICFLLYKNIIDSSSYGFFKFIGLLIVVTPICFFLVAFIADTINKKKESSEEPISVEITPEQKQFRDNISDTIKNQIIEMKSICDIEATINNIPQPEQHQILYDSLKKALLSISVNKDVFPEKDITSEQDQYIDDIINHFQLDDIRQDPYSFYPKFIQALVIQDLQNGIVKSRVSLYNCPINLQKEEILVWFIDKVTLYEEIVKNTHVGGASGVSIKIAKGVYYRQTAFKAEPIQKSYMKAKSVGFLLFTNKHIYFYSQTSSIKFAYNKILAYVPLQDGIGIQPDRSNAKTKFFVGFDGCFVYNLVSNIRNIE